jgi:hypothetical protein
MTTKQFLAHFESDGIARYDNTTVARFIKKMSTHEVQQLLTDMQRLVNDDVTFKQLRDGTYNKLTDKKTAK